MKTLAKVSMLALCATVTAVGVTGIVQLAATTPPVMLSEASPEPGVNRAEKADRLVGTVFSVEVVRNDKADRDRAATVTQVAERHYTVESYGSRRDETTSSLGNMDRMSPSEPSIAEADAREDLLAEPAEPAAAPAWDGTTGVVIQPVADTSPQSTNFATEAVEPEQSYAQELAERTGRRVNYLWDLLKGSIGVD